MIGIDTIVYWVLFMLGAAIIFGLLFYLIDYIAANFPTVAPWVRFIKVGLVVLIILLLIGIVLDFMGHPIVRFDNRRP